MLVLSFPLLIEMFGKMDESDGFYDFIFLLKKSVGKCFDAMFLEFGLIILLFTSRLFVFKPKSLKIS